MLCARDATPLAEEVTGSKRPDIIGTGVVGTVGGGMGTGNERNGGGVFFTADLCRHLSHWRVSKVCILLIVPAG
jgi:hypothetical protein